MNLPIVILPGYFASGKDYQLLAQTLNKKGFPTEIVPLKQKNWYPTLGGRSVTPIIKKIDQTVNNVLEKYQVEKVNLIGHSAGGWIARIYLGEKPYHVHGEKEALWSAHKKIAKLITLGTPHLSQERWTKKNLDFVAENYPGAYYSHIDYICIAGKAIYGEKKWGSWLAYESYKLTCGNGSCWGDGITPVEAAHLKGAKNLVIEGVQHSPNSQGLWYGSKEILEHWISYLTINNY